MGVRKDATKNGKWLAEFYKDGKRVRRWFDTKGEASRFFNAAKNPLINLEIQTQKRELRKLSDLVNDWFELHGRGITSGEKILNTLKRITRDLDDPIASTVTSLMIAEYRSKRLAGQLGRLSAPAKAKSINTDLAHLRAMFNILSKLGKFKGENPLNKLPKLREVEPEIFFLRLEEIPKVLAEIDKFNIEAGIMARVCLATGARWGEIEKLHASQVVPYKLTFTNTKSKKNRSVPISEALFDMLPKRSGFIFNPASQMRSNLFKIIKESGVALPKGKATHIFRHTFASHFMMNGGNILVLKEILGHSDIQMTMRYAHFAPSHLQSAVTLNPLSNLP